MPSEDVVGEGWTQPPREISEPARWAIRWGVILGAVGLFDLWRTSKRDGSTLSESVRYVLATDTPEGKAFFEALLIGFHKHILK